MSAAETFWETVWERFDPELPPAKPEWRVERPYSPRDKIIEGLGFKFSHQKRYLMIGTVGTGKTTELQAIAHAYSQDRMVVFFDVHRHFDDTVKDRGALDHIEPWEVLFLIGLAVYGAAKEQFGIAWSQDHLRPFQDAVDAFAGETEPGKKRPSIDIAKLAATMLIHAGGLAGGIAATGLQLVGSAAKSSRWEFPIGGRRESQLSDQDGKVRNLLDAVNLLIGTIQSKHMPLLIAIDGMDRIRQATTTQRLFTESTLLGSLSCATVVSGPLALRRKGLASQVRHFEPQVLANVPVLDQEEPGRKGPGIEFLIEIYRRRVQDLGRPEGDSGISESFLGEFAYYSGGRVRDFIKLVRMAAERALHRKLAAVDSPIVEGCIDERRRLMEMGLNRGHLDLLEAVARDPDHVLPDNKLVDSLLDQWCLLPYPNESEWYYPHPLLMKRLVRAG